MARRKKRPMAAFNYSKLLKIGDFIVRVRGIVTNFINNATPLGTPSPTTLVVSGHIDDLQAAQDAVQTRVLGAATTRNLKYDIVLEDMFKWQNYVQNLADGMAVPDAINIISLSGFELKQGTGFEKPNLSVKATFTPTTVRLVAKRPPTAKRVSYEWQQSANGGVSWTNLPTTLRGRTLVSGLTSKGYFQFRFRTITKDGTSGWSSPEGIVIQ